MYKSILITLAVALSSPALWAGEDSTGAGNGPDLTGEALPVNPDRILRTEQVELINLTCQREILRKTFKSLTGETCVDINLPANYDTFSEIMRRTLGRPSPGYPGIDFGCQRRNEVTTNKSVNYLFSRTNYNNGFGVRVLDIDVLQEENIRFSGEPKFMLKQTVLEIEKRFVPNLNVIWGSQPTLVFDELGNLIDAYYYARDFTIDYTPANPFWKNADTSQEVRTLPLNQDEVKGCILRELSNL